jgi:ribosomal protein S18 acetylase RimI-like enzyme
MKLEVNRENFRAINLYLKNGFKELGDYEVLIIRNYE